jgi:diguanylate cyclase (GGDEF)-like protein
MGQRIQSWCDLVRSAVSMRHWRGGVLGLIACVCILLIEVQGWQLWRVHDSNIEQAALVTATTARSMAEQADTALKTADTIVASLVEQVEAEGTEPEARTRYYRLMTSLVAALPAIHEMGVIDEQGNAIVKSLVPDPTGLNYAERAYFKFHATHPDRGPFIGARLKSKIDGTYNITVTRRLNHSDGSFAGVVVASVSLKYFQHLFDQMQAKAGGILGLIADDGTVLARSPVVALESTSPGGDSDLRRQMLNQPDTGSVRYTSAIDNVRRYGSYQHLAEFPMTTLVAQSEWEIQASYRAQFMWNAMILLAVMIVVGVMGSRIVKANGLLNAQAMQDGLTGLANRRVFDETIKLEFRRAAWSKSPISIVLLDIDHFKDYNDLYGHLAGDECLRAVTGAVKSCVRRSGDLVARYGGEEIVLVLPGLDAPQARELAESMRTAVHDLALPHAHSAHGIVTFSGGVATYVPGPRVVGWQILMEEADSALYAAKSHGRDRVETLPPPGRSDDPRVEAVGTSLPDA